MEGMSTVSSDSSFRHDSSFRIAIIAWRRGRDHTLTRSEVLPGRVAEESGHNPKEDDAVHSKRDMDHVAHSRRCVEGGHRG